MTPSVNLRRLGACFAVLTFATAHADEPGGPIASVGWLHRNCLAASQSDLAAGTEIQIVLAGKPQTTQTTKILGKAAAGDDCPQLRAGRSGTVGNAAASYFKLSDWNSGGGDIGIGLIGALPPAIEAGLVKATVDGVSNVVFTQCATGEGMQFNAWAGTPNSGEPLWEGYYGLDYDLQPSCP
jgi:hypothetical protein